MSIHRKPNHSIDGAEAAELYAKSGDDANFLFEHSTDDFSARIVEVDSGYVLTWTDYVINWWGEHFTDLSAALVRTAALVYCCDEQDNVRGFNHGPDGFVTATIKFFDEEVTS